MSRSKDKGTRKETQVVRYLRKWFPDARRDTQKGARDEGDVKGVPDLAIEVKYRGPGQPLAFPEALREAEEERQHAGTTHAVAMVHRSRKGVEETYCVQPLRWFAPMYHALARATRRERQLERVLATAQRLVDNPNDPEAKRGLRLAVTALELRDEGAKRGEGDRG